MAAASPQGMSGSPLLQQVMPESMGMAYSPPASQSTLTAVSAACTATEGTALPEFASASVGKRKRGTGLPLLRKYILGALHAKTVWEVFATMANVCRGGFSLAS